MSLPNVIKKKQSLGIWYVLGAIASLLIIAYVAYPLANLVWDSFHDHGQFSFAHYTALFSGEIATGVWNALWVSLLSTLGAACIGVPASLLLHTRAFPGRRLASICMYAPLMLPPLVGMFAFWLLFTDIGFFPNLLAWILGSDRPMGAIDGIPAVILVHAYSFSVYFYALCSTALQRRDQSLIEAARSLGAGSWTCFTRITFPHLVPSMVSASALCFMLSMGSFSAPYILANGTPFLSVLIYEVTFAEGLGQEPQLGLGAALSVLGAVICVSFLIIAQRWQERGHARRGAIQHQLKPVERRFKYPALCCAALLSFSMLLPQIYISIIACCDYSAWDSGLLPSVFTNDNFVAIFSQRSSLAPFMNSAYFSLIALVACLLWCLLAAAVVARGNLPGKQWQRSINVCMMLPLALPGTVIAFSLKSAFSVPTPQTLGFILDHAVWLLPLAYCVRCLPLAYQPLLGALESADPSLDEAARSLGARPTRRFFSILLPHMWPACMAACI